MNTRTLARLQRIVFLLTIASCARGGKGAPVHSTGTLGYIDGPKPGSIQLVEEEAPGVKPLASLRARAVSLTAPDPLAQKKSWFCEGCKCDLLGNCICDRCER